MSALAATARQRGAVARVDPCLVALIALAAVVRFATLGVQSLDFDETFTVGIVSGSLGHALHQIPLTESSPPLYYVLAWGWAKVFGAGAVGLRSLSALCGTATVAVVYAVGDRLGGRRAGLAAGVLAALSPELVWYSQEARTYALLTLLGILTFWALLNALERPDGRRLLVWAVCGALAVASHYFAGFLLAAEAAWLIWATRSRAAVLATGAVAAVGAALLPLALRQADHRTEWIATLPFSSRIGEVTKKFLLGEIPPVGNGLLAVCGLVVVGAGVVAARRLGAADRRSAGLALGIGLASIAIPFVLDLGGLHYLISKNVLAALPLLLVGAGVVLGGRGAGAPGAVGAAALAILFAAVTLDGALDPAVQRYDFRDIARALGAPAAAEVVVAPHLGDLPLAHYLPGAAYLPAAGGSARQVVVALPTPAADAPAWPAPPSTLAGAFSLTGLRHSGDYTLECYMAARPQAVVPGALLAAAGGSQATAQVWPRGGALRDPCLTSHSS